MYHFNCTFDDGLFDYNSLLSKPDYVLFGTIKYCYVNHII